MCIRDGVRKADAPTAALSEGLGKYQARTAHLECMVQQEVARSNSGAEALVDAEVELMR